MESTLNIPEKRKSHFSFQPSMPLKIEALGIFAADKVNSMKHFVIFKIVAQ